MHLRQVLEHDAPIRADFLRDRAPNRCMTVAVVVQEHLEQRQSKQALRISARVRGHPRAAGAVAGHFGSTSLHLHAHLFETCIGLVVSATRP